MNSTFVNHHDRGTFVKVGGGMTEPVALVNTAFVGPGTDCDQATAQRSSVWTDASGDAMFVDSDNLDVHLRAGSPLVDAGVDPGEDAPDVVYVHPSMEAPRTTSGAGWDIGAYELVVDVPGDTAVDTADTTGDSGSVDSGGGDTASASEDADSGTDATNAGGCGCDTRRGAPPLTAMLVGALVAWARARRVRRSATVA